MVTRELVDYIRLQKNQGLDDGIIRNNLLNNRWSEEDIANAFLQINNPGISQPKSASQSFAVSTSTSSFQDQIISSGPKFQPQASQSFVVSSNNDSPDQSISGGIQKEQKPKMIKTISVIFFINALGNILRFILLFAMLFTLEMDSTKAGNPPFIFLKYFPKIGLIPVIFSFMVFVNFYIALKMSNGSRFSFWAGILSLIILPVGYSLFVYWTFLPLYQSSDLVVNDPSGTNIPKLNFLDPSLIFYILILIMIIVSYKKFRFENTAISLKGKIFLVLLIFLIVIPTTLLMGMGFVAGNNPEDGYAKAQSSVNYHIYKPQIVPGGRTFFTVFQTNQDLGGLKNAVQVAYDVPFDERFTIGAGNVIILRQVGVGSGFDLSAFVDKETSSSGNTKISLSNALNQKALLHQSKSENGKISLIYLYFITPDNVLIRFATMKATKEELLQMAQSLK